MSGFSLLSTRVSDETEGDKHAKLREHRARMLKLHQAKKAAAAVSTSQSKKVDETSSLSLAEGHIDQNPETSKTQDTESSHSTLREIQTNTTTNDSSHVGLETQEENQAVHHKEGSDQEDLSHQFQSRTIRSVSEFKDVLKSVILGNQITLDTPLNLGGNIVAFEDRKWKPLLLKQQNLDMESLNAAKNISTWKLNGITVVWTPSLPTHWIVTPRNGPPTSAAAWTLDSTTQFLKSDPSMACLSPNQKGLIWNLYKEVDMLLKRYKHACDSNPEASEEEKRMFLDDSLHPQMGKDVRLGLCTSIKAILSDKFNYLGFFSNYHVWDYLYIAIANKTSYHRLSEIDMISTSERLQRNTALKNDIKLRAFICKALSKQALDEWMLAVLRNEEQLKRFYEPTACLVLAGDVVINALAPLSSLPFKLREAFELEHPEFVVPTKLPRSPIEISKKGRNGKSTTDKSRRVSFSSNLVDVHYFEYDSKPTTESKSTSTASTQNKPALKSTVSHQGTTDPDDDFQREKDLLALDPPVTNDFRVVHEPSAADADDEREPTVTLVKPGKPDAPPRTESLDSFFMEANADLIESMLRSAEQRALSSPSLERRMSVSLFKSPEPTRYGNSTITLPQSIPAPLLPLPTSNKDDLFLFGSLTVPNPLVSTGVESAPSASLKSNPQVDEVTGGDRMEVTEELPSNIVTASGLPTGQEQQQVSHDLNLSVSSLLVDEDTSGQITTGDNATRRLSVLMDFTQPLTSHIQTATGDNTETLTRALNTGDNATRRLSSLMDFTQPLTSRIQTAAGDNTENLTRALNTNMELTQALTSHIQTASRENTENVTQALNANMEFTLPLTSRIQTSAHDNTENLTRALNTNMELTQALTSHIQTASRENTENVTRALNTNMDFTQPLTSHIQTSTRGVLDNLTRTLNVNMDLTQPLTSRIQLMSSDLTRRLSTHMDLTQPLTSHIQLMSSDAPAGPTDSQTRPAADRRKSVAMDLTQPLSSAILVSTPTPAGISSAEQQIPQSPLVTREMVATAALAQMSEEKRPPADTLPSNENDAMDVVTDTPLTSGSNDMNISLPNDDRSVDSKEIDQLRAAILQSGLGLPGGGIAADDFITPNTTVRLDLSDFPIQTPVYAIQRPQPSEVMSLDKFLSMTGVNFAVQRRSSFSIPVVLEPRSENSRMHAAMISAPLAAQVYQQACAQLEEMIRASKSRVSELEAQLRSAPPPVFTAAYQAQSSQSEVAKLNKTMKMLKSAVKYEVKRQLNEKVTGEVLEQKRLRVVKAAVQSLEKDVTLLQQMHTRQRSDLEAVRLERTNYLMAHDRDSAQHAPNSEVAQLQDSLSILECVSGWMIEQLRKDYIALLYCDRSIGIASQPCVCLELQLNNSTAVKRVKAARIRPLFVDTHDPLSVMFADMIASTQLEKKFDECTTNDDVSTALQSCTNIIGRTASLINELTFMRRRLVMRGCGKFTELQTDNTPLFYATFIFSSATGNRISVTLLFDSCQACLVGYRFQKCLRTTTITERDVQSVFDSTNVLHDKNLRLRVLCARLKELVDNAVPPR